MTSYISKLIFLKLCLNCRATVLSVIHLICWHYYFGIISNLGEKKTGSGYILVIKGRMMGLGPGENKRGTETEWYIDDIWMIPACCGWNDGSMFSTDEPVSIFSTFPSEEPRWARH